jgi:phenylpyruvate tautomerase PptA (4-oxalocrotonate tautomerase family)
MPFINLKTNVSVSQDKEKQIKSQFGQAITAIPGKSENWLMVGIEPEYKLWFKGDDAPCAMIEVSIFGKASSSDYNSLTEKICSIISSELGVSPSRTYVKYSEISEWGWNNGNF